MNPCVIIPAYNHAKALPDVVNGALPHCPVIVVDDGSTDNPVVSAAATVVRFEQNRGKAAALRAGFAKAAELGFTHAITMDADGQHSAGDVPAFLARAREMPDAFLIGVRDFVKAGAPPRRRRANAISRFWFRVSTGVRLDDAQCGFRCYPLGPFRQLRIRSERYAYELEAMIRAAWAGMTLVPVPVQCRYDEEFVRGSHFRPVHDFVKITNVQIGFVLQAWLVPAELRATWAVGENRPGREVVAAFFRDHAQEPVRLAGAVGLGLCTGIAPLWGIQMATAITLAHLLRVNKAITLLACNISFPPFAPPIFYAGIVLGHWLLTGQRLTMTWAEFSGTFMKYFWDWVLGSFVLSFLAGATGFVVTYGIARVVKRR
jgi:uncharacterized protein (DUF2062 family)